MSEWQKILEASPNRFVRGGYRELCRFGQTPETIKKQFCAAAPVFLATPYSEEVLVGGDWSQSRSRSQILAAQRESVRLTQVGFTVISPIATLGPLLHLPKPFGDLVLPDPLDPPAFRKWRAPLLDVCRIVVVPDLPGSSYSRDILDCVSAAIRRNKLVYFYGS